MPLFLVGLALSFVPGHEDTSYVEETSSPLTPDAKDETVEGLSATGKESREEAQRPKGVSDGMADIASAADRRRTSRGGADGGEAGIKFHAVQIIKREGGDPERTLPIGTSAIGRLLTAIDTREQNPFVKVLLPYGASFNRERKIQKNSVVFGTVSYPGSGNKVYIKLTRLLDPGGQEFRVDAQALSSLDYSPGLAGDLHGAEGERLAATLGLTMIAGMSDVLVEKEAMGQTISPTPKSSMKNAFYNGLTRATEDEAQRQAGKLTDQQDYVTIDAGQDVIVSLTETFKGEPL